MNKKQYKTHLQLTKLEEIHQKILFYVSSINALMRSNWRFSGTSRLICNTYLFGMRLNFSTENFVSGCSVTTTPFGIKTESRSYLFLIWFRCKRFPKIYLPCVIKLISWFKLMLKITIFYLWICSVLKYTSYCLSKPFVHVKEIKFIFN